MKVAGYVAAAGAQVLYGAVMLEIGDTHGAGDMVPGAAWVMAAIMAVVALWLAACATSWGDER